MVSDFVFLKLPALYIKFKQYLFGLCPLFLVQTFSLTSHCEEVFWLFQENKDHNIPILQHSLDLETKI